MPGIGSWRSWFRSEAPVAAASEPQEAPAPVYVPEPEPELRRCEIRRGVLGKTVVWETHSVCGPVATPLGSVDHIVTTEHGVV